MIWSHKFLALAFFNALCLLSITTVAQDPESTISFNSDDNIPPNPHKPPAGSQSLKVPQLTDEEKFSRRLPDALLCDACQATAYQLSLALSKAEGKLRATSRRGKPLRESEYLDVMEGACAQDWNNYGVKDVDGVHRLSGPGLEAENHFSMMYGGGDWPSRLERKCREILGEVGEDELYEIFRADNSFKSLCSEHSTDCQKRTKKSKLSNKTGREEL